ncbi:hypothetical protein FRC11_003747 [Ceratobasidium sp. 423]|nr:hypothetical protein FRC11_003747 [Ceratobasidium sp. 423]
MIDSIIATNLALSVGHDSEHDWKYYYVNRFVDRDMMIRYLGGGIGHFDQYTTQNPAPDITNEIDEDEVERIELDEFESEGIDANEDIQEDLSDASDVEEADGFMSGEEDFIDDLYDLQYTYDMNNSLNHKTYQAAS